MFPNFLQRYREVLYREGIILPWKFYSRELFRGNSFQGTQGALLPRSYFKGTFPGNFLSRISLTAYRGDDDDREGSIFETKFRCVKVGPVRGTRFLWVLIESKEFQVFVLNQVQLPLSAPTSRLKVLLEGQKTNMCQNLQISNVNIYIQIKAYFEEDFDLWSLIVWRTFKDSNCRWVWVTRFWRSTGWSLPMKQMKARLVRLTPTTRARKFLILHVMAGMLFR
jgi:hypothetical protein